MSMGCRIGPLIVKYVWVYSQKNIELPDRKGGEESKRQSIAELEYEQLDVV